MPDHFDTETEVTTTHTQDFAGEKFDDNERAVVLAEENSQITKAIAKVIKNPRV